MQGPYRPAAPPPDPELVRLAMQGAQRQMEVTTARAQSQSESGESHFRTAVGAYRGSALKRFFLLVLLAGCVFGVVGIVLLALERMDIAFFFLPGFLLAFLCIFLVAFIPPTASNGAMAAERQWMTSRPFLMVGYVECLSVEPRPSRSVAYELTWQPGVRPPDPALLHGIFLAVDPRARLEHVNQNGARIVSGPIPGNTGISVNRQPVYRNHRFGAAIHAVVDQVLLPLHRSCPIASLVLSSA